MQLMIVALKDRAADLFGKPFYVRTTAEAVRSLTDEANNAESTINKHPEDYDLFLLGSYDEDTGRIEQDVSHPSLIVRAQDLIRSTQ
ncbi:MAG: nonstructural protein [Microviridae sp.]|nr:MAG: nonstructural protein [Microviridae sp.]